MFLTSYSGYIGDVDVMVKDRVVHRNRTTQRDRQNA